jgi:large subunit ribosomal protein L18
MIDIKKWKTERGEKARKRVKYSLKVSDDRPRLIVYKSRKYLYAQVVDKNGKVLCAVSSISKFLRDKKLGKNIESAKEIGHALGRLLKEKNIEKVCFDRNGFPYHGKIKALADACREEGIKF